MKERIDMRKSLWLAAALLGALAAAGCQSEMMEPERPSGTKTLKVIAESEETRTGIFQDGDEYKAYWSNDDMVALVEMVNDVPAGDSYGFLKPYEPVSKSVDETGRTAIFNYELKPWQNLPENPVFRYMGVSPVDAIQDIIRAGDVDADAWGLFWGEGFTSNDVMIMGAIPSEQSPSSDSFDPACDVLVSKVIEKEEQPEELRFSFARIGSIAKITLKGLPRGYYITSGTFAHSESWQGTGDFDYNTQLERVLPLNEFVAEQFGEQLEAEPITFKPQGVQVNDAGEAVIWLRTLSGKLTDWFSIDVALSRGDDKPSYRKVSKRVELGNKSITFREGAITAFSVTLDGQAPIAYDEETTLKFFPELANGDQAVIRIPKDYSPDSSVAGWRGDYGYPLFFDSYISWENIEISFPYGYTAEDEWISLQEQDGGYYLKVDSHTSLPETATLVFTPDDPDISPIEIPIEGFNIITFKKDGYYVDREDWDHDIFMNSGQTSTFTAEVRLPSWLEMVQDSFRWTVEESDEESEDDTVSYEGGPDNSLIVTAGDKGFYVNATIDCTDHLTEAVREYENYIWVDVYPRFIPLKWNGVDWNGKTLMLTYETVTVQADLNILSEEIEQIDWNWSDQGWNMNDPIDITQTAEDKITIEATDIGQAARIELNVTLKDGTVYYSSFFVDVSPVMLEKKTGNNWTRLYGDPIVLSPNQSCQLKVSFYPNSGYGSADYKPKWSVASNRYISVDYYSYRPYESTVTAMAAGDDYVIFELWYQWGDYQHQTDLSLSFEYPVHVLLEDQ